LFRAFALAPLANSCHSLTKAPGSSPGLTGRRRLVSRKSSNVPPRRAERKSSTTFAAVGVATLRNSSRARTAPGLSPKLSPHLVARSTFLLSRASPLRVAASRDPEALGAVSAVSVAASCQRPQSRLTWCSGHCGVANCFFVLDDVWKTMGASGCKESRPESRDSGRSQKWGKWEK
jgi:hypothetical protein